MLTIQLTGKGSENHPAYKKYTRLEIPSPHQNYHPYLWTVLRYLGEGIKCYYQLYYILNINKYTMVVI